MTFTSLNAEETCLNDQAPSASAATPPTASRSASRTGAASASTTPPARDDVSVDYFTLGSGIASGHHHAYLPDPWVSSASGPAPGGSAGPSYANRGGYSDAEKKSADGGDDIDGDHERNGEAGLVSRAAKFGSKRGRHAAAAAAAAATAAGSPSSASASSVSVVGSVAEIETVEQQQKTGLPAPLRLARTASRPRSVYSLATNVSASSPPSSSSSSPSSSPTVDHTPPRITFPEGGLQAWLVVFGSFCAMVSVFGVINTAAVFESWFATHQLAAYTASEIGWVFSLYLFIVFFIGIQVGPVFDRYGPRWLVALGSVLVVASIMLLGFCEQYYQILLCYSVLGGLGGALLNTPAYACIAHFFNARRGLATGIATTSGSVGGIAFPILLQQLLPRLGFAWSTRILGFILLGLSVPANLWLRTRLPLPGVNDCDAEAASSSNNNANNNDGAASVRTGATGASSLRRRRVPSVWPDVTIFRDRRYAVAAVGIFFMEWGIFVPLTFIVSYATAHSQDVDHAYTLLALLNAGSVLGRVLPGVLADKFGRFNVIIVTIALSSAVLFGVWLPAGDSRPVLTAFAVLFGFASGSNLGLIAVCLGQLCEPSEYGRFYSTAMMVASFGTLSSVPIGGAILGDGLSERGWQGLIAFSGAAYALALVCYVGARVMAVGWGLRVKF